MRSGPLTPYAEKIDIVLASLLVKPITYLVTATINSFGGLYAYI